MDESTRKLIGYIVLTAVVILSLLTFYGAVACYFPAPNIESILAWPVIGAGLFFTYLLSKSPALPQDGRLGKMRKPFWLLGFSVFIHFFLWSAIGWGFPAVVMRIEGPNGKSIATVKLKGTGSRSCHYYIELNEFSAFAKDRICINKELFDSVHQGGIVSLTVRNDFYGVLIFEIASVQNGLIRIPN